MDVLTLAIVSALANVIMIYLWWGESKYGVYIHSSCLGINVAILCALLVWKH